MNSELEDFADKASYLMEAAYREQGKKDSAVKAVAKKLNVDIESWKYEALICIWHAIDAYVDING